LSIVLNPANVAALGLSRSVAPKDEFLRRGSEALNNRTMVLSASEESLIKVVRMLPPDQSARVLNWALQLEQLAGDQTVDWSDSWSEEDLREATAASAKRFEQQEQEER
jgi:hypothetical protein